jgi:hypothetical protein
MTRALQKHVARRQDQTFADWFAELKDLAGERWADVADQAPTIYAVWGGGATRRQRRDEPHPLPHSERALGGRSGERGAGRRS